MHKMHKKCIEEKTEYNYVVCTKVFSAAAGLKHAYTNGYPINEILLSFSKCAKKVFKGQRPLVRVTLSKSPNSRDYCVYCSDTPCTS